MARRRLRPRGVRRLRRPWHWVLVSGVVGATFALLGLLMLGGDPGETSSFDWQGSVIGAFCLILGLGVLYAYVWLPKVWFDDESLHVRQLGNRGLRATTSRLARDEVASVHATEDEHHFVPLRTTYPVIVSTSGTEVTLDGHTGYVMPWQTGSARAAHEVDVLARWAGIVGG